MTVNRLCNKGNEKAWQTSFIPKPWNCCLVYAVSILSALCQREIRSVSTHLYTTLVLKNRNWSFCISFLTYSEGEKKKFRKALLLGKAREGMCIYICFSNAYKFTVIFRIKALTVLSFVISMNLRLQWHVQNISAVSQVPEDHLFQLEKQADSCAKAKNREHVQDECRD